MLEKLLKETEHSIKYKENYKGLNLSTSYEDMGFRMFEQVVINDSISLSIQASYGHYCSPRQTLPIEKYESFELAIFKDNEFTSIEQVTQNDILIKKLNKYYEGTVYANVPVEIVEELYEGLLRQCS